MEKQPGPSSAALRTASGTPSLAAPTREEQGWQSGTGSLPRFSPPSRPTSGHVGPEARMSPPRLCQVFSDPRPRGQTWVLTDGRGSQALHNHLRRLAARVEGRGRVLGKAEADDGEGGGLNDEQAGPGKEVGRDGAEGLHQVWVLAP